MVSRHGLEPCERGGHCTGGRACEWAQPRWGWVPLGTVTQGSSQTRNLGLEGAAPLGLGEEGSMSQPTQFLLYTAPDGAVKVDVFLKNETVWLTQKALAELFGVKRPAITKHLLNIFSTGELAENSVCSILEHTAGDGKTYSAKYYNLDAIIAVGYRVNSFQATQFRIWATKTLREFITKGFVMDDERLKESANQDYFDELDRKSTRLNSSHEIPSRMPSSA